MYTRKFFLLLSAVLMSTLADAKVKLQPLFTDNMVLQQNSEAPVWGHAKAGKRVTVTTSWDSRRYTAQADANGKFMVRLTTPKAGGPYSITFDDGSRLTLNNVLIGEVWLCSGQSNMEMPMQGWSVKQNQAEIEQSGKYQNIRMLQLDEVTSPVEETAFTARSGGWMTSTPDNVRDFSATAWFFGKNITLSQDVPVGLIMTCWGGTPIEAWMSAKVLGEFPEYRELLENMKSLPSDHEARKADYANKYEQWIKSARIKEGSLDTKGNDIFAMVNYNDSQWRTMSLPAQIETVPGLENFDGILWFRKTVNIPASWAGKDLELNLACIDDNDVTFFGGTMIGHTRGFDVHRRYTVPGRLVKAGKMTITVGDLDTGGGGGIYGDAKDMSLGPVGSTERISLSGTWRVNPSTDLAKSEAMPKDFDSNSSIPTVLFNRMIKPLIPFAIRGAIWYQGEANENHAYQYRELLPAMIGDWRDRWGYDFPFYIMQLANYGIRHEQPLESNWAELREAQIMTAEHVPHCATAVNTDIGNHDDIHPTTKDEVGRRLALLARALTYGERIEYTGPMYNSFVYNGNSVKINFTHADGLKTKDGGAVKGVAIAGPDRKFHWADAVIEGSSIVVSSPAVQIPIAVRYAWDNDPVCNLVNSIGLPASPFRTDDWPGITFEHKK